LARAEERVRLHTPNGLQARLVSREVGGAMKRAGFETVRLSLETVEKERQADWGEKVNYAEFLEAVGNLKAAGFRGEQVGGYVMTGLPGETEREAARNIAAVHAAGVEVKVAEYSPIPGTEYFERARAAAEADIEEPLLQNNTITAAGGIGGYEAYERVKAFAHRLNKLLAEGKAEFSVREVEEDSPRILEEARAGSE